jgi:hypothetical protein
MNASLGFPLDIRTVTEKANDLSFANSIGLVKWGGSSSVSNSDAKRPNTFTAGSHKFVDQVKKVFRFLVP